MNTEDTSGTETKALAGLISLLASGGGAKTQPSEQDVERYFSANRLNGRKLADDDFVSVSLKKDGGGYEAAFVSLGELREHLSKKKDAKAPKKANAAGGGMATVGDLVRHLSQFDPNASVCMFEMNTGDWQQIPADMLGSFVHTAKEERKKLMERPEIFENGKMESEINDMLKYVGDADVLVRF